MDYDQLAKKFGGQVVSNQPQVPTGYGAIMNGLSPKDQAEMRLKMYGEGQKRIDALREVTAKGADVISQLERFGQLNRDTSTGGLWEALPDWKWLHGKEIDEMNSIASQLGPSQRTQGSGSSSDRDVNLFMSSLPSTENDGPTNYNIRQRYKKQYDYALDKQTFLSNYLQQNGHLIGADEAWIKTPQYSNYMKGAQGVSKGNANVRSAADEIISRGN